MPSSGPVYQPTTVQYEGGRGGGGGDGDLDRGGAGGEHSPGGGGDSVFAGLGLTAAERWRCSKTLSQRFGEFFTGRRCLLWGTLLLGIAVTAGGIRVTVDSTNPESTNNLLIEGIILLLFGIALLILFAYLVIRQQRGWTRGKSGIETGSGSGGAGSLGAPNPSTDPLVAAQYAPVKDAPPSVDDERRQLMDNKECLSSAEESDKMVETDPRIVLKPLKNTEDA